jgi:hypothetical protein
MRVVVAVIATTAIAAPCAQPASAATWAPASSAAIHPGVQLLVSSAQCTGGFILADAARLYISMAANCAIVGQPTDPYGCTTKSLPLGTPVEIAGAAHRGTLVYSSWLTMQSLHEKDQDVCEYNDFALVAIDPADAGTVNPSVPEFGGPVGEAAGGSTAGERVYTYGRSALLLGMGSLGRKQGVAVRMEGSGFAHRIVNVPPGIPGDAGSAVLDSAGRALGILITIAFTPIPASNGVVDLARALDYMSRHSPLDGVSLATGTEHFGAGGLQGGGPPPNGRVSGQK